MREINEHGLSLPEMFGYEKDEHKYLIVESKANKKLGSLVALVALLHDDMSTETMIFALLLVEQITGRELRHGVGSFIKYLATYLSEDECIELAAKTVLLVKRMKEKR
tara:strand:+ start:5594 stop:5917 length:324 start_codon:yes stop_codon:yes gene_type:complete